MTFNATDIKDKAARYTAAWCSHTPSAVAAHYSPKGEISINRGDALVGRAAITEMAAGFYAEFPDLVLKCDGIRVSDGHVLLVWTLEGHHAETKNLVRVGGWEEWELDDQMLVKSSLGWFDAQEYDRQIAEGI